MNKNRKLSSILLSLLLLFTLTACSIDTTSNQSNDEELVQQASEYGEVPIEEKQTDEQQQEIIETVTIRSIGDILVHDTVYQDAYNGETYNFDHMFDGVREYLQNADITTANLETIAAGSIFGPTTYPLFNAPEEIIDALQNAGVDIVNNATNHTMDYGVEGVYASIDALKERKMEYVGSYESWEDYNTSRIIDVGNISVGFLSYANDANGNYVPEDQAHVLSLIDTELIPLEVERLSSKVDVSVVFFHNGNEYDYLPSQWQLDVMQLARDAGANFILGGHPHYVQPFVLYNSSQAAMFSHGNFLTGQYEIETKMGGITEYSFNKLSNGEVVLESMRFMPTYNFGMPETSVYSVVPLADAADYGLVDAEYLFQDIAERMTSFTNKVEVVEYLD
ncbi:CapA family protein [Aerococcaceae bacterium WGS1372]